MRKLLLTATALSFAAPAAFAGGYEKPIIETEPVVVAAPSTSNPALVVPAVLLLALAVAAGGSSSSSTSGAGS
ncbi:hypothetical protein EOW65_14225 [Sinirhodobacter ferrireducens]|uniref:Ferrochelatase n=1 Tax=Paenirhodobacter ferrireducens TaxID=1215032 RepID=A0A443LAW8_9RHOB|nr:hypothetical protein [Sinirhodobacter ferrireducens]RWR46273.1 hypothetical protein EOW65_14225 [Sinirhodobacter ferrireducens]